MTSQYRCETCKFFDGEYFLSGCPLNPFQENIDKHEQSITIISAIKYTGCASHSNFQYPIPGDEQCRICQQATRKDATEKVLDLLTKFREERQRDYGTFIEDDWDEEWEYIKELRKGEQE